MVIPVTCESCGHDFKTKDEFAGQRGRCPKCDESILVPLPEGSIAVPDRVVTPVRRPSTARAAPPTHHVEDLTQDAFSPAALGAGVGTAVVAAAVWAFVYFQFSYEHGLVAWGVGGAIGFAMVLAGGRGLPMAVTAAVLSLASIFGGKLVGLHFSVRRELTMYVEETFTREVYDERVVDARDYAALGTDASDEDLTAYLLEHGFSSLEDDISVSDLLPQFHEGYGLGLLAFQADAPEFETWREESAALYSDEFSIAIITEGVIDELGRIDLLFAFFGLATAFKLLLRASAVPR